LDADALTTVRCPICNTLLDPKFVSERDAPPAQVEPAPLDPELHGDPIAPADVAHPEKSLPDFAMESADITPPIKRSLRMRLRKFVDWSRKPAKPVEPAAKAWEPADPIQEFIEEQATSAAADPTPNFLTDTPAADAPSQRELTDSDFTMEFLPESPAAPAPKPLPPMAEFVHPRNSSAEDSTAAASASDAGPELTEEEYDVDFLDEPSTAEAELPQLAEDIATPPSASDDSAEDAGQPREITSSDLTMAFLSFPQSGDPSAPGAVNAGQPRELTDSDFEMDFLDEPAADAPEPVPGPRTVTDSDFTIAFVDPPKESFPEDGLLDQLPKSIEAADQKTAPRELTDSDFTMAFVDPPKLGTDSDRASGDNPPAVAPSTAPRELTDSDFTMAFVPGAPPAAAPDSGAPRTVTESDHTMAFVDGDQAAALAAASAEAAAKTHDISRAGMTVDLSEIPAERLDMITGIWSDSIPSAVRPNMTIKAASADAASQTHLVVRPRLLHSKEKPASNGADYELLETIGEGGMGVVYAARQASIDRTVAIKMIRGDMAADADQRQKFLSEAVVTGDLDHPNIVPIYDLGSNDGGALFYSMKRVQGTPWMKAIRQKTLEENLDILMKVSDAVAFAHNRGVVHRDLKPENVMLGEFGEVLVMDWGLALLAPRFRHLGSITQSGGMGGTPAYMAPEMASGPVERIGMPADIYLLGAILFEILTGKPPHAGKDVMSCLYAVARNDIEPTEKSGELMDIARKAMATEIDKRYESVQDFQAAIREYHSHAQSIQLATRAEEDLVEAEKSRDYQDFARSVFGLQEALELWSDNHRAREKLTGVKLAYASCAMTKGDLDLADSLLDAVEPSYIVLREQINVAKSERNARQQRLKFFVNVARALVAAVVLISTVAFFAVRHQRNNALAAEAEALAAEDEATRQRDLAEVNRVKAEQEADRATQEEQKAIEQRNLADEARKKAIASEHAAVVSEKAAQESEKVAVSAKEAEAALRVQKEYEAYIAQIGLVSAKIDENAFGYAAQLLEECKPELRHWEWGRLMRLCRQSAQTLVEDGPINAASFSPDGRRALTGSWDGKARVWDLATGKPLLTLEHGMYVHTVAYSPDGRTIATGSDDAAGEIRLWDAESGALKKTLDAHTDQVLSVAFSRDGSRLLTGSYDNTARLWNVETGEQIKEFKGHSWWVWSAFFSPDETQIVTASQDGTALVWSVETGTPSPPFSGHLGPVYSATFSPDGKSVASCGDDKRILLWSPQDLHEFKLAAMLPSKTRDKPVEQTSYTPFVGHMGAVRCVRFSPDGNTLLSGSHDNTVKLWDVASVQCLGTLRGHAGWVRACSFSADGKSVLSAGFDHNAKIWNVDEYEEVRTLVGHEDVLLAASFSPDGSQVVTASRDRTARLWDAVSGRELKKLDEGHLFLVSLASFSPDGRKVITGAGDSTVRIWDNATGGELVKLDETGRGGLFAISADGQHILTGGEERIAQYWDASNGQRLWELKGHRSDVTALACSPDGKLLYTGDVKGHGKLWDATTGQMVRALEGHSKKITAAVFLPGGQRLLTSSHDHVVGQWDVATGKELTTQVLRHPKSVDAMAVTPNGANCVTACDDGHMRVWKINPPQIIRDIELPGFSIQTLTIASDGRHALCACSDNKVRVWDLATGTLVANPALKNAKDTFLNIGQGTVWSAAFSPDGSQIITGGGNDAKLWQVESGRQLMAFSPHGAVASAAFSPDAKRVATGSWDGMIKFWNIDSGKVELKLTASKGRYINSVAFSPDGSKLLTGSDDAAARLWDSTTGKLLLSMESGEGKEGHTDAVRSARFSSDGRRIVTASNDKTARIWDTETGQCLKVLTGHDWAVLSAVFSTDGKRVITASDDKTARIWDAETGEQLNVLAGHTASVTAVAFTPDGARAATGSQDNAIKLWDAVTGKEILHLKQHSKEVSSVTFSPDGKSLLTSGRDGTAIIWPAVDWR